MKYVRGTWNIFLAGMVVAAACAGGMPARAESQPFYAILGYETPQADGPVWLRYYTTATDKINPCSECCRGTWDPPYCEVPHTNKPSKKKVGYKGHLEDIFNFDGVEGNAYHAVWDTEFDPGTPWHAGYYAWMARVVAHGETSDPWKVSCIGTTEPATCLGNSDPDFSAGHEEDATCAGALEPWGGLIPIPVPVSVYRSEEEVLVEWNPAVGINEAGEGEFVASYDLYTYVEPEPGGEGSAGCPDPDEMEFLKHVEGTTTTLTPEELGITCPDCQGFYLALRIVYPPLADGTPVRSRYLSASSLRMMFVGNPAEVVNLEARWLRRNQVQVSWETELEDGVVGFYVQRAFTPNGPFERVSDLIPANGESSRYTWIDTVTVQGRVAASGLYYKIEAVEAGEGRQLFGPVRAELPAADGPHEVRTPGKRFRF